MSDPLFPAVTRTQVIADDLAGFRSESAFMAVAVDLLKETTSYVCIAACILGDEPTWTRDRAVVGGNAVRLFKLLSLFLEQTCEKQREATDILARLTFETAVNIRYLIQNFSPQLIESYIRYSLRHERKLRDRIAQNIEQRGGEIWPIEDRMLQSLARAERVSGVQLDSIKLNDKAPWGRKNLYRRAEEIGWELAYLAVFSGMSHNVHGAWQDLLSHHLEDHEDGTFLPTFEWSTPRPQPLFALGLLMLDVIMDVAQFLGGAEAVAELEPKIGDLQGRIMEANNAHEKYLSGKTWPAI